MFVPKNKTKTQKTTKKQKQQQQQQQQQKLSDIYRTFWRQIIKRGKNLTLFGTCIQYQQ